MGKKYQLIDGGEIRFGPRYYNLIINSSRLKVVNKGFVSDFKLTEGVFSYRLVDWHLIKHWQAI